METIHHDIPVCNDDLRTTGDAKPNMPLVTFPGLDMEYNKARFALRLEPLIARLFYCRIRVQFMCFGLISDASVALRFQKDDMCPVLSGLGGATRDTLSEKYQN